MNEKSRKLKYYEMKATWDSFEWLIKEQLIKLDNLSRAMLEEMRVFTPESMIAEYLPAMFERLKNEVVAEQVEKYDGQVK